LQTETYKIHRSRLERLRFRLSELHLDALLLTHLPNIFYLTGFTGSAGALLVGARRATFYTDGRYRIQAKEEVNGADVKIVRSSTVKAAAEALRPKGSGRIRAGFAPERVTVQQLDHLEQTSKQKVKWVQCANVIEDLRGVKDDFELAAIREAAVLAGNVWQEVLPKVKPGVSEMELAAEIDYRLRLNGASGPSFETIVASGPRSALPHARPSPKRLKKNELVVFDLGAILRGYCSDITRTVYVGRAPSDVRRWYQSVLDAHDAALEALVPGRSAEAVDAAARKLLRQRGIGRYFSHSTGHGLGIEVHESPRLGRGDKTRLENGNVVTIEPGVYFKGVGGIRIEDDVLVSSENPETLSRAERDFLEL
jgi:Xaa-Pro aminopeptidase